MARTRTIRPSFWTSFTLGQVSRDARLLFIGLWTEADDEGRLIDSPKGLAGAIFPHDEDVTAVDITGWLDELVRVGSVKRYQARGASYLYIPTWDEHQKPPHRTASRLPTPPRLRSGNSRMSRENLAPGFKGLGVDVPVSTTSRPQTGSTGAARQSADGTDGDPKPNPDRPEVRKLSELMLGAIRACGGRSSESGVSEVARWALGSCDYRALDEWIGAGLERNGRPRSDRYFVMLITDAAAQHGIEMPTFSGRNQSKNATLSGT